MKEKYEIPTVVPENLPSASPRSPLVVAAAAAALYVAVGYLVVVAVGLWTVYVEE